MTNFDDTGSLIESAEWYDYPYGHMVGRISIPAHFMLDGNTIDQSSGELCAYGLGKRRQNSGSEYKEATNKLLTFLEDNSELKAFMLENSQNALGCNLDEANVTTNARKCVDESSYYLSPHADCPKTICALIIYLWHGKRGTSLYRLSHHSCMPPSTEHGLQERENNFTGRKEFQQASLDVITTVKPECYANFKHVTTIYPDFCSFLFIPNTRFRHAIQDLPTSYHGVSSKLQDTELDEQRQLILIDMKICEKPKIGLRSRAKSQLNQRLNQAKKIAMTMQKTVSSVF
ncbi:hypothetical protein [Cyanobium sp. ATX 6F1]|uniref:hypothetical protein n=1 Tax=unclassified Cyanobium TaxID=2627006 RepID=UPI0020CE1FB6|nr:hypothetical protein [Cyanobium sp. ATX 6F1]MCP9916692.1 hypothetical protein [Cyanobium sp. ATX 6F1]